MDPSGDVLVAGAFTGTLTVSTTNLNSAGFGDILVAKLSASDGRLIWVQRFGGTGDDSGIGVATDGSGDVYVTGYFADTAFFGGVNLASTGGRDAFLAKVSGVDGTPVWARGFGGTGLDEGFAVAVDASNNVLVTGYSASSTAVFGGLPLMGAGGNDVWIGRYSTSDGGHGWSKRFGALGLDAGTDVAVDGLGNVVLMGYFQTNGDAISFGGPSLMSNSNSVDIFVAKLDDQGDHLWSKTFGGTGPDYGVGLAVDGTNGVIAVGSIQGTVSFGGSTLTSAGGMDIVVAKYSAAGAPAWARSFGSSDDFESASGIATTTGDDVLVSGYFRATADLGGTSTLTSAGSQDGFVGRYRATDGAARWVSRMGGVGQDLALGIAASPTGAAYAVGTFTGLADFGALGGTSVGLYDGFCVQVVP